MPSMPSMPSAPDTPHDSTSSLDSPDEEMTEVKGLFTDRAEAEDAVYRLGQESVPSDSISVFVAEPGGDTRRELAVDDEAGTLRGALWGLAGGAALGLLIVALLPTGLLGPMPAELFDAHTLMLGVGVVAILAVAGLPLGAVIGMGHWRSGKRISEREFRRGSVWVAVRSDELAAVARRVLRTSGAARMTG